METKNTIYELQRIAKQSGFYLIPESVLKSTWNTIEYLRSENDRLKKRILELKEEVKK